MNFKEILELIDKVADRDLAGLEIEQAGTRIRIEGRADQSRILHSIVHSGEQLNEHNSLPALPAHATSAQREVSVQRAADLKALEEPDAGLHVITSPIVGTFYRSPNPEAQMFVNVGDRITKGKVLCIVEAMKLMNEIESDVDGEIQKIYPQNGQPIEYGEKLFAVKIG